MCTIYQKWRNCPWLSVARKSAPEHGFDSLFEPRIRMDLFHALSIKNLQNRSLLDAPSTWFGLKYTPIARFVTVTIDPDIYITSACSIVYFWSFKPPVCIYLSIAWRIAQIRDQKLIYGSETYSGRIWLTCAKYTTNEEILLDYQSLVNQLQSTDLTHYSNRVYVWTCFIR